MDKHYLDKDLYIDYCSQKASEYSVYKWHYSQRMPKSKLVRFGVWEKGEFKGSVIYGLGANKNSGTFLKLSNFECPELVRVALGNHKNTVSKIVSYTLKKLKKDYPNLKAIISYADPERDHKGKIYQAMNWYYIGKTKPQIIYYENGKAIHSKTINDRVRIGKISKNHNLKSRKQEGKHKYVYLFDKKLIYFIKDKILKYPS